MGKNSNIRFLKKKCIRQNLWHFWNEETWPPCSINLWRLRISFESLKHRNQTLLLRALYYQLRQNAETWKGDIFCTKSLGNSNNKQLQFLEYYMALKILSPDFDFLLRTESIAVCFIPQVQGQETPVDCLSFETIKQQANSVTVQNFLDTKLVLLKGLDFLTL